MRPRVRSILAHQIRRPHGSKAKHSTRRLLLRRFTVAVWFFASLWLGLSQIVSTCDLTTASAQTKRLANLASTQARVIPLELPQDVQTAEPLTGNVDDPAAAADTQEAQATEELQQLIAQAQECLTNLSASKEKAEAILRALQALTSALELKARLFEEGKIAEAAEADQEVNANQQQLEQAVDESVGELASVDPPPQEDILTPGGESKLDRIMRIVDFTLGVVERIVDLRDRFRGYSTGIPPVDPYQPGIGDSEEIPIEEEMVLVSGQSWREEA